MNQKRINILATSLSWMASFSYLYPEYGIALLVLSNFVFLQICVPVLVSLLVDLIRQQGWTKSSNCDFFVKIWDFCCFAWKWMVGLLLIFIIIFLLILDLLSTHFEKIFLPFSEYISQSWFEKSIIVLLRFFFVFTFIQIFVKRLRDKFRSLNLNYDILHLDRANGIFDKQDSSNKLIKLTNQDTNGTLKKLDERRIRIIKKEIDRYELQHMIRIGENNKKEILDIIAVAGKKGLIRRESGVLVEEFE